MIVSQQIHAKTNMAYGGLKQSLNFLSVRLVQLVNNIKLSSEKYLQKDLQDIGLFCILYLEDTFEKYRVSSRYF